jgi:hypothetical protein
MEGRINYVRRQRIDGQMGWNRAGRLPNKRTAGGVQGSPVLEKQVGTGRILQQHSPDVVRANGYSAIKYRYTHQLLSIRQYSLQWCLIFNSWYERVGQNRERNSETFPKPASTPKLWCTLVGTYGGNEGEKNQVCAIPTGKSNA